jgi:hypothetical protein
VIVCGLFQWKQICTYCLFIFVLPLEIQLSIGEGWDPINRFNPVCAHPSQDLDFHRHMSQFFIVLSDDLI